jgi:hypothetical protein
MLLVGNFHRRGITFSRFRKELNENVAYRVSRQPADHSADGQRLPVKAGANRRSDP